MDSTLNIIEKMRRHCKCELDQVNQIMASPGDGLADNLAYPVIGDVISSLSRGKGLRSLIVLMIGKMLGFNDDKRYALLAAAAELIHMATLLHDDVIDNSDLRRGRVTVNRLFDNKTGILVGDYVLGAAFDLLLSLDNPEILRAMVRCTITMVEGELTQLHMNGNYDMTIEEYMRIASEKTGLLFSSVARAAGILGCSDHCESLGSFGMGLGIAFQIADDIIDYCYGSAAVSKKTGNDFYNGLVTLPAILAISVATSEEKLFWVESFSSDSRTEDDFSEAKKYISKHNTIEKSLDIAKKYIQQAEISTLPFKGSVEYDMLSELLRFIVQRTY